LKIWLDDLREPVDVKLGMATLDTTEYEWMKTAQDVITTLQVLKEENYEYVEELCLDHDLGHYPETWSEEKQRYLTGEDVLIWIEKEVEKIEGYMPPQNMSVHSANPVAAKRMRTIIGIIWQKVAFVAQEKGKGKS